MNKLDEILQPYKDFKTHCLHRGLPFQVSEINLMEKFEVMLLNYIDELQTKAKKYDDKETPKKVVIINHSKLGHSYATHCPNCNEHVIWEDKRCLECGQKLDWSDIDEISRSNSD